MDSCHFQSRLREIFLKSSNRIKGKYLAELVEIFEKQCEHCKYCLNHYRLATFSNG
eukprot:m.60636 g.60636  ORF g.60636 m.60636 type:complete len:56 (+) comp34936_c1_seq16:1128-1295(+)